MKKCDVMAKILIHGLGDNGTSWDIVKKET